MIPVHIVPASKGPWALQRALKKTKQSGEVLIFPDQLSVGPVSGDITRTRNNVQTDFGDITGKGEKIEAFWRRLEQEDGPINIWFGRHSADELAMLLALCDCLGDKELFVTDVTNLSVRASWNGASPSIASPRGLDDIPLPVLVRLVGKQVPIESTLRHEYVTRWRVLQAEDAPRRIVSEDGLRSATAEEFDWCLTAALSHDWRRTAWVVLTAADFACREYRQIDTFGMFTRVTALVDQGILKAKGSVSNFWDDEDSALRLPASYMSPAQKKEVLHVTSHPSFAGFLAGSLSRAGRYDDTLGFADDLSIGPIASDDVCLRAKWWNSMEDWPERGDAISAFWRDVATGLPLVVWFGRGDARDLSLYFALCDRMPERIAAIGDVSTISVRYEWLDGTMGDIPLPQNVHGVPGEALSALTAFTALPDPTEIAACGNRWRQLKSENAPFRVAINETLVSQPSTYFDNIILGAATTSWQKTIRVVGNALHLCNKKSHHVDFDVMVSRIAALVTSGALDADGDPWQVRESRVRLAPKS